jgi:hypothetical protein
MKKPILYSEVLPDLSMQAAKKLRAIKPSVVLEKKVLKACLDWLKANQIFAWRNNTGSFVTEAGGYFKAGLKGSPDIIGMTKSGQFLAIECKSSVGVQSAEQKEFEHITRNNKGIYLLVQSVDDLMKFEQLIKA